MYKFRLYYSVNGKNKRRTRIITLVADTLYDAWRWALESSIDLTEDGEILNSIQIIEEEENDNEE